MEIKFLYCDEKDIESAMAWSENQRNTCSAMMGFEEEDEAYTRTVIGHSVAVQDQSSQILGVMWDHVADAFRFDFTSLESHVSSMPNKNTPV